MRRSLTLFVVTAGALLLAGVPFAGPQDAPTPPERDQQEPALLLDGVVLASDAAHSIALVRRPSSRRGRPLRIGEAAYGFELREVSEDGVVVEREGKLYQIWLDGGAPVRVAVPSEAKAPEVADGASSNLETYASGGDRWLRRELDRSMAEERFGKEMPVIVAETGLIPRLEDGQVQGLKITALAEGTILTEIGLQPGDILLSINETPLSSLPMLVRLYPRLQSENQIRVVVERQGRTIKLAYDIH